MTDGIGRVMAIGVSHNLCTSQHIPVFQSALLFVALMEYLMTPKMARYVALRLVSFRGEPNLFWRHIPADKG